ncbi:sensor histidine kinase [Naasia sp. SYSU D00057]|uniref:sensor histidine kinase n=1 Tax=Naasia sp. SYSU D00057 TaxID=2817380 RepID=UPI001B308D0E|nr:histidine kinase [Naasia sp. SYSU D00057]
MTSGAAGGLRRGAAALFSVLVRVRLPAVLVLAATAAAITLLSIETPIASSAYGIPLAVAFGLVLAHVGALPLAVVSPVTASVLALAASLALQLLSADVVSRPWPWWPVMIVTHTLLVLIVGVRAPWTRALGAWLVTAVASFVTVLNVRHADTEAASQNLVTFVSITGGVLVAAIVLMQWHSIRRQLISERQSSAEEYSRRVLAEDRARIARELHDVVAHSMSIINIQASTARYRDPSLSASAIEEFEEIATSSRQALGEMRGLLGVLRPDDVAGELSPQPGVRDIAELVAQARRNGMRITLEGLDSLDADDLSEVVGLTAYRIVQEALTNAFRHAPGAPVWVNIERSGLALVVSVRNGSSVSLRSTSGSRLGLIGMRERVTSVSGSLQTEKTADDGFLVRAVLPIRSEGTGAA